MRKKLSALLATLLFAATLTAVPAAAEETADNAFVQNEDGSFISGGISFPLEEKMTFTFWRSADANMLDVCDGDINNNTFFQELERRTNVHFDFVTPAVGTEREQYSLMITSGNLCDVMSNPDYYADGIQAGVEDEYFLDLTELLPVYAPDYMRVLEESGEAANTFNDDGTVATMGMIFDRFQAPLAGFVIRKDWLDDLNLEIPETFDELEEVLTKFKEEKGATAPLAITKFGAFCMSFAYNTTFVAQSGLSYRDGDRVADGLLDNPEGTKAYMEKMHDWFEKGLLDPNFMSAQGYMPDASMLNTGTSGVAYVMYSQIETKFTQLTEAGGELVGIPFPKVNKDDVFHSGPSVIVQRTTPSVTISAECEHPEILIALFNYLFTEPGYLLENYGIEGDTYNMVDGEVVYTEKFSEEIANAIRLYTMPSSWGPSWVNPDRQNPVFSDKVKEAQALWTPDDNTMALPNGLVYTAEEMGELADITVDLYSYEEECFFKMISGSMSFDEWDSFVETCKSMGLERSTEIKQAAFDRYLARTAE